MTDKNTLYVPKHLRHAILNECHDDPIPGAHLGFNKIWKKIENRYYWKKMREDIKNYVKTCHTCQIRKIPRHRPYGSMQLVPIPHTKTPEQHGERLYGRRRYQSNKIEKNIQYPLSVIRLNLAFWNQRCL